MIRSFFKAQRGMAVIPAALLLWVGIATLPAADSTASAGAAAASPGPFNSDAAADLVPETRVRYPERVNTFDDLFNRDSGPTVQPPRPPTPPPKRRSLLDDPGNWGFLTPEDVVQEYMSRHVKRLPEYLPDGRDWNELGPLERFHERQNRARTGANREATPPSQEVFGLNGFSERSGVFLPENAARPLEGLTRFANPNIKESVRPEAISDLFGMKNNPFSPEAIRERNAQQRHIEAFRNALESKPAGVTAGLAPSTSPRSSLPTAATGVTPPQRNPYDPATGVYIPSLAVTAPAAPAAPAGPVAVAPAFQPDPSAGSSRIEPPRVNFSLPQRSF